MIKWYTFTLNNVYIPGTRFSELHKNNAI